MTRDDPQVSDAAWTAAQLADPHAAADKAGRVRRMFAAIAPSYDLNNRLHSLGRDQAWRRAAVRLADVRPGEVVIDAACGTGDLALAFVEQSGDPANQVIGLDFTRQMLHQARRKAARTAGGDDLDLLQADAAGLPLADACCDVVSIAFGLRNVADPAAAIREFHRVLRPGGRVIVLEFSTPPSPLLRRVYHAYSRHVMPRTASWIARDRTGAYRYLPRSVDTFLDPEQVASLMRQVGFGDVVIKPLTFGVAVCHRGVKAG